MNNKKIICIHKLKILNYQQEVLRENFNHGKYNVVRFAKCISFTDCDEIVCEC